MRNSRLHNSKIAFVSFLPTNNWTRIRNKVYGLGQFMSIPTPLTSLPRFETSLNAGQTWTYTKYKFASAVEQQIICQVRLTRGYFHFRLESNLREVAEGWQSIGLDSGRLGTSLQQPAMAPALGLDLVFVAVVNYTNSDVSPINMYTRSNFVTGKRLHFVGADESFMLGHKIQSRTWAIIYTISRVSRFDGGHRLTMFYTCIQGVPVPERLDWCARTSRWSMWLAACEIDDRSFQGWIAWFGITWSWNLIDVKKMKWYLKILEILRENYIETETKFCKSIILCWRWEKL